MKHIILLTSLSVLSLGQARFASIDIKPIDEVEAVSRVRIASARTLFTTTQVSMPTVSMRHLLMQAFGVLYPQIIFTKNVPMGYMQVDHSRYSLNAAMPKGASLKQVPDMLQSMLVDKFGLSFKKVTQPTPTYSLIMGRTPKLYPFRGIKSSYKGLTNREGPRGVVPGGDPREAPAQRMYTWTVTDTAAGLAQFLSDRLRYPVVDNTGLKGIYTFVFSAKTGPILEMSGDPLDEADLQMRYQGIRFQDAMLHIGLDLVGIQPTMQNIVIDKLSMTPQN